MLLRKIALAACIKLPLPLRQLPRALYIANANSMQFLMFKPTKQFYKLRIRENSEH